MPTFTFSSPEGKQYSVTGPDGATLEQAFGILQQQIGQGDVGQTADGRPAITVRPGQSQPDNVGGPVDETVRAFNNGLDALKAAGPKNFDPKNYNAVGGLMKTGRAIAAIPEMASSWITGPGTSAIGNIVEGFDKIIPLTPEQKQQYGIDSPREAAGKAMMAVAPRGFSPVGARPVPVAPPPPGPTPRDQLLESAGRLGVDIPRAVASDTMGVQQTGKIAANIPIGGTPLRKASQNAINQLDEAATRTQQGYGSGSPVAAGRAADEGITDYIKNRSADRVTQQYDKVDALINPNVQSPLTRTAQEAQSILARRDRAGIAQPSEAVNKIMEAATRPGMTYEGIKDLRTYIGELMDTGPLPADISRAELKRIYGSLTGDLRESVRAAGGAQAVGAWERANRFAQATAQRRENLARIVGGNSDEQIFSRIASAANGGAKGDIQLLSQARRAVDNDTWDEIASAVISSLGRSPAGDFTPDRFVTAWGKMSPQAKSLLFKSTGKPQLAQALDDISTVSQRFKTLQQFANPSGTGQTVLGGVIGGGAMVDPVTAATSIMSARIVSEILARPVTAKAMSSWAKAYAAATSGAPAAVGNYLRASAVFASDVANAINAPQHAAELARQLQGAVPVRAGDQQKQ
jgi:hypothetical protein